MSTSYLNTTGSAIPAGSSCPPSQPLQNPTGAGTMGKQLLGKLGIATCSTQAQSASAAIKASFMGLASMSGAISEASSSSYGCDDINAVLNAYSTNLNDFNCIVQQDSNTASTAIISNQSVNFTTGPYAAYSQVIPAPGCTNPQLTQATSIKLYQVTNLSEGGKTQVVNSTNTAVNNFRKQAVAITNGYGATPQGQKDLQALQDSVSQNNNTTNITKSLNNISLSVTSGNTLNFVVNAPHSTVEYPCSIDQQTLIDIQTSSVLSEYWNSTMGDSLRNYLKNSQSYSLKEDNKGQPSAMDIFKGGSLSKILMAVVGAIIVIAVIWILAKSGVLSGKKKGAGEGEGKSALESDAELAAL